MLSIFKYYYPLSPSVEYSLHLIKILILKYEGSIKKISYERCCLLYVSFFYKYYKLIFKRIHSVIFQF